MGLSVVEPPESDPLTLIEAKSHLRVTGTDEDGDIAGYIIGAREWIESQTHLKLITQTLDLTVDDDWPYVLARGYYRSRIEFPVKPVASVTSISYVDANGTTQALAANQYALRNDGPVPYIEPAYNVTWPVVRRQTAAITVRFVAGSAVSDIPEPLRQAMRLLVAHQYEERQIVNAASVAEIPMALEAMISPYRFTRIM